MPPLTLRQRCSRVAIIVCAALALALPTCKNLFPAFPSLPCGFKSLTGLPCLFCGGTRAAWAAMSGHFEYSLYMNALALPALAAITLAAAICLLEILRGRPIAHWHSLSRLGIKILPLVLILLIAWWSFHMVSAVRTPKPELVDSEKSIAARLRALLLH